MSDGREPRLLHTTNGGEDWAEVGGWNPEIDIYEYAHFQFVSPTEAWFVPWRDNLLLHTTNGGVTIKEATSPFADDVYATYFLDTQTGWVAGEAYYATGSIAKTTDGGATWEVKPTPRIFGNYDLFFLDQDHGWAAGWGIPRTQDGGESWSIAKMDLQWRPDRDPLHRRRPWLGGRRRWTDRSLHRWGSILVPAGKRNGDRPP